MDRFPGAGSPHPTPPSRGAAAYGSPFASASKAGAHSSLTHDQLAGLRRQSNLSTLSLSPNRPRSTMASATTTGTAKPGKARAGAGARAGAAGADESRDMFEQDDEGGEGDEEEGMVDRMRCWRNDAMTQHLYGTAQFWGAKVFQITCEQHHPSHATPKSKLTTIRLCSQPQRRLLARPDALPRTPVRPG